MSLNTTYNPKNVDNSNTSDINNRDTINGEDKPKDPSFACNICLESPTDAVVSLCGHLFCWSCLHRWLAMKPGSQVCPVCNSAIGRETVVPIYGRENTKQVDPRETIPPRPSGHRTERVKNPVENSEYTVDSESDSSSNSSLEDISLFNEPSFNMGNTPFQLPFGNGFPFGLLSPIRDILEPRPSSASSCFSDYIDELDNSNHEI